MLLHIAHRLDSINFLSGQEEYEVSSIDAVAAIFQCLFLFQRLRPMSYSKSHVILIAFALDTPDSLENVTTKVYHS